MESEPICAHGTLSARNENSLSAGNENAYSNYSVNERIMGRADGKNEKYMQL